MKYITKNLQEVLLSTFLVALAPFVVAEELPKSKKDLREPIFRVTKSERTIPTTKTAATAILTPSPSSETEAQSVKPQPAIAKATPAPVVAEHPLHAALRLADKALVTSKKNVKDYTAILVKRERVNGRLNDPQYMFVKLRNEKKSPEGKIVTPFSFYLKFLKPSSVKGREVVYTRGKNNGRLVAHEGGLKGRFTPSLNLDPHGAIAMMGQRYPATDIGIENLCSKLLVRGKHDMKVGGNCSVEEQRATVDRRPATRIEVTHHEPLPKLDFHKARIYLDDEYGLPVRYEAYDWPARGKTAITEDELIEEYTYVRLNFNVGLTDKDFDAANSDYNMK